MKNNLVYILWKQIVSFLKMAGDIAENAQKPDRSERFRHLFDQDFVPLFVNKKHIKKNQ